MSDEAATAIMRPGDAALRNLAKVIPTQMVLRPRS
jgi:hypothetical protein